MVLTETWLKGDSRDATIIADINNTLPDHQMIHQPRSGVGRGGGVCVLLRKGYSLRRNTSQSFKSFKSLDISISSGSTCLRLIAVYRPPPSKKNNLSVTLFLDEFSTFLEDLVISAGHLLITGDFNFHMNKLAKDSGAAAFLDLIESFGLCQIVGEPTHKQGHLLDLIITRSPSNLVADTLVQFELPSDHALVTSRILIPRPTATRVLVNHRMLKKVDMDAFKDSIRSSPLSSCQHDNLDNLDVLVGQYNTELHGLINTYAPLRIRYITFRPHAPWFDDSLRTAKQAKRRLERKWRSTRLEVDRQMYKEECENYQRLLDKAKSSYHSTRLSNCDQRELFKEVDKMTNGKRPIVLPKIPMGSSESLADVSLNISLTRSIISEVSLQ